MRSIKTEKLKFKLNKFLQLIPDKSKMPNYVTAPTSNSILDQLSRHRAQEIYNGGGVFDLAAEQA